MRKENIVLIGNGMAGIRTIEEILKKEPNRFTITIFGKEPYPNYNRILLSKVLQGDSDINEIILNDYDWYEEKNITLYAGDEAEEIDKKKKVVRSRQGRECPYDHLIIATGSNAFMLPLPGADKEGVIAFRDIKDTEEMISASKKYRRAVVIGGGLLGLEAARGLLNLDMETEVVHNSSYLMERQLDEPASRMLKNDLEAQGMRFHMAKDTEKILGKKRVEGLKFKDGSTLEADLVVMAVGIRPNAVLAGASGIDTNRAILVNDHMETSVKDIYAVGECAEHNGIAYGLVAPLYEQGKVLAERICAKARTGTGYQGSLTYTQLKVSGVDVFSAGTFQDEEDTKAIRVHDEFEGIYKKVVVRDNRVVGAVLYGETADSPRLLEMMKKGQDITGLGKTIILPSEQEGGEAGSLTAAMEPFETICGCNGVCKGDIVEAIQKDGLTSVEEVKKHTNAARSCGGCKPLVADLLAHTLGDEAGEGLQEEPMCGCTDLTHEEVGEEIRTKQLTLTREVMNVLHWKTSEGCSKCRPAINYYLGVAHPKEYEDDPSSRFVNERMHANIQNDGTYSVVPRMYGGVTNPDQLRKIAEVADKYDVPLLKLTGGQRIDMLGIPKADLPSVWEDLNMPSGYAYAKSLRTVKTCVGEDFCRFGTQDSIGLGIAIEKKYDRLNTPHKVKMAVSACPRNCAESGIKDLGIVGVEGAWELYAGGNGGVDLKGGELLTKVQTTEEVIDTISAYLQYYRENARYLERTSHWIGRVGLEHVKSVILDNKEERKALIARMDTALEALPEDPWKSITSNEKKREELFEQKKVEVLQ
ncbi:assimilatory nitrite reductase (NAD(P)H) large subunit precursor [Sinobaca qinghaiensis]|uniref:Assimilatory nitrite reductase (NAD(P)H) large subunit n=1 Tax=Sinobaca qinghaiensis TaxID=342944 RepID=A0A419V449_9BACL|nr:nitrite reductase large subunit NirB [Sinobaca qinghaiensis]RKD73270.1 assimilatory nitrite reductase (NAD(P)H) large subunit precursor [Sinobaca qinghaiensis]